MSKDAAEHRKPATRSRSGMIALIVAVLSSTGESRPDAIPRMSPPATAGLAMSGNTMQAPAASVPLLAWRALWRECHLGGHSPSVGGANFKSCASSMFHPIRMA
jgi:hypothetical protein